MILRYLRCFIFCHIFCFVFGANFTNEEQCLKTSSPNSKASYICQDLISVTQLFKSIQTDAQELAIINSNLSDYNDEENYMAFEDLQSISITKSLIGPDAVSWLYSLTNLRTLRIDECSTNETVNFMDDHIPSLHLNISPMMHLQSITITRCNISNLDSQNVSDFNSLPHLSLPDNKFECSGGDFIWLLDLYRTRSSDPLLAINLENAICFVKKQNGDKDSFPAIYTIRDKDFLVIMQHRWECVYHCPDRCQCSLIGISALPIIKLDCVGLNLTQLPSVIPKGSTACNFSNNLIEDMTPYFKNKAYESVTFMGLSHNRIKYLDANQLVHFLRTRANSDIFFTLNQNRLAKFPALEIMKLTKDMDRPPTFYLGDNPYICSCDYIREFRTLIFRNMRYIYDTTDIKCSEEDPYSPGEMIYKLKVDDLCPSPTPFHTLDVINIILGIIVILLITNFIYNSIQYHKHRKLPWIIRKFNC